MSVSHSPFCLNALCTTEEFESEVVCFTQKNCRDLVSVTQKICFPLSILWKIQE